MQAPFRLLRSGGRVSDESRKISVTLIHLFLAGAPISTGKFLWLQAGGRCPDSGTGSKSAGDISVSFLDPVSEFEQDDFCLRVV